MKTFARYAWPIPVIGALEYAIFKFVQSHHLTEYMLHPVESITGSLAIVAGMQWLVYRQDRKYKLYLEQQKKRMTDALRRGDSTDDPS
jgi:hypothetical protein